MRVIKFIQSGEIVQLGIEGKVLYLKWGGVPNPMKLGRLQDIRSMGDQSEIQFGDKKVKVPMILTQMAKGITDEGLKLADSYDDEQFYQDFLKDYKDMGSEGMLMFMGEAETWS